MSSVEEETIDELFTNYIKHEEYIIKHEEYIKNKLFIGRIGFVSIVSNYLKGQLKLTEPFKDSKNIENVRHFFQKLLSFWENLKVFFTVPEQQSSSYEYPNEVAAAFINFLLQMVESILFLKSEYVAFQDLRTELGFLITFLGDTSMHLQPTDNVVTDIKAVVNEKIASFFQSLYFTIQVFLFTHKEEYDIAFKELQSTDIENVVKKVVSFLHSGVFDFLENMPLQTTNEEEETMADIKALVHKIGSFIVFTKNDQIPETGIVDLALSDLLPKFELVKSKIKEHCITVSKMPSGMAPKAGVGSLFIVDSVLDDLIDLVNNKSAMIVGLNDQILMLHEELRLLGSFVTKLLGTVQQEAEHEELLMRVADIAYEVEYVICSRPPIWYLSLRLPQLIEKIQLIKKMKDHIDVAQLIEKTGQLIMMPIKEMKNDTDVAGMPEAAKYPGEHSSSQFKKPPILEDVAVRFDGLTEDIAGKLIGGTKQLQIISIFGMPGIGKTTLANILYNRPSIVNRFDVRAWCVVSQTYHKKNVLLNVLSSIKNVKQEAIAEMDEESLAENVYKSLKGRRYLIVMDDIWDMEVWDDLGRFFPNDGIGSKILFTSRNKEVGLKASPHSVICEVPFLSEVECWNLLEKKVFRDKDCPEELLDIGKKIAKKCNGLPLAVVVIAGVFENMGYKEHLWQEVARSLSSHLSENPDNFIQILELSYNHLPMHLKPCFLYFGAFEEDKEIHLQNLISLWVAEGFIKKQEHKSLEDVALEYAMQLIDRSLVLVAKRKFDGSVKACKIHDLLREMCLKIAEERNFLKIVNANADDSHQLQYSSEVVMDQKHQCLSIVHGENRIHTLPFGPHVRSLLCRKVKLPTLVTGSFKVLRVLGYYNVLESAVIGIEQLVHVRYLALSIPSVFPPMERFQKLEFLFVRNVCEIEITDVLLNITSLRHMHFGGGAYFSKFIRHQAIEEDMSFPINNTLQSISLLIVSDEIDVKVLRYVPNLRRLKCLISSSRSYHFDFLNQLESLKLGSKSSTGDQKFSFMGLPLNLKQLSLFLVHMSPVQMKIIGQLKYLEVLKLREVSFEGRQWDTSEGEFLKLEFLKLDEVKLADWNTSEDHFPKLKRLALKFCEGLRIIPPSLVYIPTLLMIEVLSFAEAIIESAKQIQKKQQEMGYEDLKVKISRLDRGKLKNGYFILQRKYARIRKRISELTEQ